MNIRRTLAVVAVLIGFAHAPLWGQSSGRGWDPTGLQLTRQELQELLAQLEQTASSSAYSGTIREQARDEAAVIRQRLEEGDIRVGDKITLRVESQAPLAQTLSTDYTVVADRKIILPELGEVPLTGVLRSELQSHLAKHLARYIVDPKVQAQSSIRVEMVGAIGKPGFYMVPSDMLLTDVLMMAGGPAANASLEKVEIKRGKDVIWDGERLREAMIEGRTLDQLSVRAGDAIEVPQGRSGFLGLRSLMVGASSLATLVFLINRLKRAGLF